MQISKINIINLVSAILLLGLIFISTEMMEYTSENQIKNNNLVNALQTDLEIITDNSFLYVKTRLENYENEYFRYLKNTESKLNELNLHYKQLHITNSLKILKAELSQFDKKNQEIFSYVRNDNFLNAEKLVDSLEYEIAKERLKNSIKKLLQEVETQNFQENYHTEQMQNLIYVLTIMFLGLLCWSIFKFSTNTQKKITQLTGYLEESSQLTEIGMFFYDTSSNTMTINQVGRSYFQFSPNEQVTFEQISRQFTTEDQSKIKNILGVKSNSDEQLICIELTKKTFQGEKYFEINMKFDLNSQILYGSIIDITKYYLMNKELIHAHHIAKMGSWKLDLRQNELTWSHEVYDLFKINPNQIDAPLLDIFIGKIYHEDQSRLLMAKQYALESGQTFRYNFRFHDVDNDLIYYFSMNGQVHKNKQGNALYIAGSIQDISDQVHKENQLKEVMDQNYAILRSAKLSIISTDLKGVITSFNEEAERIIGYKADEMVGLKTPELFHDLEEVQHVSDLLSKEYNTPVAIGFETFVFKAMQGEYDERQWTYIHRNGKRTPVHLTVSRLYNSSNELYGYLGIAKDISKELEMKNNLEQEKSKALLNAKLASIGEMSAGIAHEINNPLAIIMGNLEVLSVKLSNLPEAITRIKTINKSIQRIEKIVSNLKKFSRVNLSKERKEQSLNEIINVIVPLVGIKANKLNVQIETKMDNFIFIKCDMIEIEQVFINLVHNSIDAIKNLPERWVKIHCFQEHGKAFVRIIDSGNGIPKEIEDKIFQPFFTTKPVGEGTGLGLSITNGILQEHGSKLVINKSFPNTCFEFCFEIVPSQQDEQNLDTKKSA